MRTTTTIREQREAERRAAKRRERIGEDLARMQNPGCWPRLGVLPVVEREYKPGELPRCGFLYCWDDVKPVVYLGNLFALGDMPLEQRPKLEELPKEAFTTFAELAEKWRID